MFSASKTAGPSGYNIANSLRFRSSASAYLSRTPASAGNRTMWTWSGWVKRGTINASANMQLFAASGSTYDNAIQYTGGGTNDVLRVQFDGNNAGYVPTSGVFRDPSAWYHIVVAVDTTQAVASNRVRMYVNGIEVVYGSASYPAQNYSTLFNSTNAHNIGRSPTGSNQYFDGYLAEVNFIDGQALTPSSFGEFNPTTGVWQPKQYSGTYGTNGFKLNFSNGTSTTTLGYDSSGNGNNWTTNNISLTAGSTYDWMLDSPTPYQGSSYGVGNYAVFNPVYAGHGAYISNGNLTLTSNDATYRAAYSTIGMTSGSWYAEFYVGLRNADMGISVANLNNGIGYYYLYTGAKWDTSTSSAAYGASYTTGDTIGVAFDATNLTLTFYKNGVSQGVAFTGMTSGTYQFVVYSQGAGANLSFNAGQRPFAYTPPSGYKSLCTFNLPTPTIQNGAGYMAATTYTGNGSTQSISNAVNGVSFQPDLVWVKARSVAYQNGLYDSVRGVNNLLSSNNTAAESTVASTVTAFASGGFSLGSNITFNQSGSTFVGWQWKAGGTAVTNTNGSITSQVSASALSGFSVVTCAASASQTVGHGLGVAPSMIIVKSRTSSSLDWYVYHASTGNTGFLLLDGTNAFTANSTVWNNTSPTSSVFTLGSGFSAGAWGNIVAYCFAAIPGYSAFGSYTGNGSSDGPFVYCGFRPRFVLIKLSSASGGNWVIYDNKRGTYNLNGYKLGANLAAEENNPSDLGDTSIGIDFLSNGFKIRTTGPNHNNSGGTYIYAAFAENPFQNALAR